jgi:RimJ/RimL family protein N-acetyltransferase
MPKLVAPVLAAGSFREVEQPVIGAAELLLRPWVAADAKWIVDAHRDPGIRHWHTRTVESVGEAEELIDRYAQDWQAETSANWAVVAPDGDVLGRVALCAIQLESGEAEIGYWVRAAARGRGTASAAVQILSTWAFDAGFHRLFLHHSTANSASCGVARKAGFTFEGTKRSALLHSDGWHDLHLHALISPHPFAIGAGMTAPAAQRTSAAPKP